MPVPNVSKATRRASVGFSQQGHARIVLDSCWQANIFVDPFRKMDVFDVLILAVG
jgi:hypothetical protein